MLGLGGDDDGRAVGVAAVDPDPAVGLRSVVAGIVVPGVGDQPHGASGIGERTAPGPRGGGRGRWRGGVSGGAVEVGEGLGQESFDRGPWLGRDLGWSRMATEQRVVFRREAVIPGGSHYIIKEESKR